MWRWHWQYYRHLPLPSFLREEGGILCGRRRRHHRRSRRRRRRWRQMQWRMRDCLRPRYVEGAIKNVKCICVSAGELHSGAVSVNGDVYAWGEGCRGQLGLGD